MCAKLRQAPVRRVAGSQTDQGFLWVACNGAESHSTHVRSHGVKGFPLESRHSRSPYVTSRAFGGAPYWIVPHQCL